MIPERFCIDYPTRVLELLDKLSPRAAAMDLSTTFILSLAMPMLVVPFERLKSGHQFSDARVDPTLHQALEAVKPIPFKDTPFWTEADRDKWRFAHIVSHVNSPNRWIDAEGEHPLRRANPPLAGGVAFANIIHTLRHGLAHGCVVYLDENGEERPGRRVTQIAFLCKAYQASGVPPGAHRLVVVEEEALRTFLFAWCRWLQGFHLSSALRLAA
jgi:hypothetical protein